MPPTLQVPPTYRTNGIFGLGFFASILCRSRSLHHDMDDHMNYNDDKHTNDTVMSNKHHNTNKYLFNSCGWVLLEVSSLIPSVLHVLAPDTQSCTTRRLHRCISHPKFDARMSHLLQKPDCT